MSRIGRVACAAAMVIACLATAARAEIERYAIIVGDNAGALDEQNLRYAEADAARVAEVMTEIGGVRDENQIVLRGKTADQVRRALIALNERIRVDQRAGHDAMLLFYYSGHGDADALHLADTRFDLRELEALVRGSSAQIRILVIDACRSGAVTRVKGGSPAPPIALSAVTELAGEGVIVLTASTSGEDAQESDQLAGSFFTHYLLSALRGAADENSDQIVTVAEAFAHTREQTILASSRSLGGTQHPTFHYDLRGRAEVALTDLGAGKGRGRLTLPRDATYLVMRGSLTGAVVGEVGAAAKRRTLSLAPGSYAVRGRARDVLLEGLVTVVAERETVVDPDGLARTTYARLVRKGGGESLGHVSGLLVGPIVQTAIIDGASPCIGALAGWAWVRSDVTLSPRLSGCRGELSNRTLRATTDAAALELRVAKAWDLPHATIDLGVAVGGELMYERFTTRGVAPARATLAASLAAGTGATIPLGRAFVVLEVAAQTHFFAVEDQQGVRAAVARFALRGMLALGVWL